MKFSAIDIITVGTATVIVVSTDLSPLMNAGDALRLLLVFNDVFWLQRQQLED
jgi:hypothetical protein